ncbi:hypothetical protein EO98_11315 [Methanosarcina sp. 2.H.T.1A.6]|uniref:hypothetical protein n=1 Tax=unclassified Methanosarcina TaxID=2644672 RepID=UPI000620F961|nr:MULTISPECIES: hypothetical protein [unclassified Methanosarcina]KKG13831.1 hypothetical protein EO94_11695 [Methanosarcina sp. 2.H.T.1A.3]KKG20474.1 hypothetical protein EO97_03740 [Methanosarcina sp. 2.H.T.1A.15]KKG23633.1 hypothetical protein EO96_13055 [Methanosarcina sp. 2.H.T.1A.8]KKG23791.1 hypothetical protein EO98_11315 [Methanosarcina sp. 2.H.T.1A.6]
MLPEKLKENEAGTVGLPIRIVVLSIVGFIGFYSILSALSAAPSPAEPMYAIANVSTFSLNSGGGESNFSLQISVLDRENRGVGEANVIVWSPDRNKAYSGITGNDGNVIINILNPELPAGKSEGYVAVKAMKTGYRDFSEEYFIKVKRS